MNVVLPMSSQVYVELTEVLELQAAVGTRERFLVLLVDAPMLSQIRCGVVGLWTFIAGKVALVQVVSKMVLKIERL